MHRIFKSSSPVFIIWCISPGRAQIIVIGSKSNTSSFTDAFPCPDRQNIASVESFYSGSSFCHMDREVYWIRGSVCCHDRCHNSVKRFWYFYSIFSVIFKKHILLLFSCCLFFLFHLLRLWLFTLNISPCTSFYEGMKQL